MSATKTTKVEISLPCMATRIPSGVFSDTLVCNVYRVICTRRAVHLCFPEDNCCDMGGAVRLASMLHGQVKVIVTYAGHEVARIYWRTGKKWRATRAL